MHVAMIGQKGIPARIGGVERHVEELAAHLVNLGVRVTVYTRLWYTPESRKRHRGVRLISLPSIRTKYLDAISHTFLATIHAIRSDAEIIHYHAVGPALLSWVPRIFSPSKKVVVTFHCIDRRHEKWNLIGRIALRVGELMACKAAHETIAVSRTLQHYAENLYRSEVKYIPNGVSLSRRAGKRELEKFGLCPGGYLLVVTRFVRHKGVHTVLKAWEKIQDLPSMRELELVLVGGASFGESYIEEIREFAGRLKRVHVLGEKEGSDLEALYSNAKLYIHASVSEGLPIVVLEAMACGAPVLASDIPEHMELVSKYGWSFKADDSAALAQTIRKLLANERKINERAFKARFWVSRGFNWETISSETHDLYETALGERVMRKYLAAA